MTTITPIKPSQNPVLKTFWKKRARNRVLYGGRSSSKSWDAGIEAVKLADNFPLRILCTRQFQNKIEESVYTLLKNQIKRFSLSSNFKILNNKIIGKRYGSEFVFYGLWRHIEEIKSLENIDILWIEEAHNLTAAQWEILEPTIRKQGSQVWIIFNPKYANDFVYQKFVVNPPPDTVIRMINYDENPFLSDTILKVIQNKKESDPEGYNHTYLGQPLTDDDQVIIKRSWIQAAIDAHKTIKGLDGPKTIGYDVADSGADLNATVSMDGSICFDTDKWKGGENELTKSTKRVKITAMMAKADIIYDSIGVGAGTGSTLNNMSFRNHAKFNAAAKVIKPKRKYEGVKNKDFFSNLKAQAWWITADRFRNTYNAIHNGEKFKPDDLISICSDCSNLEQLMVELSTPRKDFDKAGRVKVESKDDLKARDIKSPNLADAFIMAANKGLVGKTIVQSVNVTGF